MSLLHILSYLFLGLIRLLTGKKNLFKFVYETCIILSCRRKGSRFTDYDRTFTSNDLARTGIIASRKERDLEYRRNLKDKETDSVLVFGANSENDRLLARVSTNGQGLSSSWFHLHLSSGKTYTLEQGKLYNVPRTTDDCFVGGPLRLRCLVPLRKWKLTFNGVLKETERDSIPVDVHAKITFIFTSFAIPHDLKTDITPSLWAEFNSDQRLSDLWHSRPQKLYHELDSYVQAGCFAGSVQINGGQDVEIAMWGSRKRSLDNNSNSTDNLELIVTTKEGQMFHTGAVNFDNVKAKSSLKYGLALVKNGVSYNMNSVQLTHSQDSPADLNRAVMFNDKWNFELKIGKAFARVNYSPMESKNQVQIRIVPVTTHDDVGTALILYHARDNTSVERFVKPLASLPKLNEKFILKHLVIPLSDFHCQNSVLTGGKGSSLGCLNYLKNKVNPGFNVPKGVVVTTTAYLDFVKAAKVLDTVKELENVTRENSSNQDIEEACKKTTSYVSAQKLPAKILEEVVEKLTATFGDNVNFKRFAVRSSAAGEDSEELSAAGQMQTFLGVSGLNNVSLAIVKCWASQFSFTAVQYKRQNGQLLNSPMAVVVQEMVASDVAGVMFTCNPVTGNPKNVTLTANYGIGESVVSASADPDTIVFERQGSDLKLKSTSVGKKKIKTIMSESGGVVDVTMDEESSKKCSLPDAQAHDLVSIALKLEEIYGCPLDIEWGISENLLYFLQARPITTLDQDSSFIVDIENNSPVRGEEDYFTRANVGEVMNGAISPLGAKILIKQLMAQFFKHYGPRDSELFPWNPFSDDIFCIFYDHGFLNMNNFCLRFYKKGERSFVTESLMIAGFGRILEDQDMLDKAHNRNIFYPPPNVLWSLYFMLKDMFLSKRNVMNATKKYLNAKIPFNNRDSAEKNLYTLLQKALQITEPQACHLECSGTSSLINCAVMSILVSEAGGWTQDVFADLSRILSSCSDVVSADVPSAIEDLSEAIYKSPDREKFVNSDEQKALEVLQKSDGESGKKFRLFLKNHGHRCINEFDPYAKPWRVNPMPVIETLQEMLRKKSDSKKCIKSVLSLSETINGLKVKLSWKSKLLLRFLIPLSRRAVACREHSKSLLIRMIDLIREPLSRVAVKMVEEGRLPDQDLFYYFSLDEVFLLMETRSSRLIQKALKKRAAVSRSASYKFDEITKGPMKPINKRAKVDYRVDASFTMKGISVSEGLVKAPCRVALTLEDAKLIQQGEILIAYGTDIGWTPYFPMLAGVATELGGLVSHGAVVAREYGLPCVVGLHGATERFRSGDIVLLDGAKGVLQKLAE